MQRSKSAVDNLKGVYILHCWTFVGNFDQKLDKVRYKVIELQILKVYRFHKQSYQQTNHKYIIIINTSNHKYNCEYLCKFIFMNAIEFAQKFVWLKYYSEYYISDTLYEKYKG